MKKKKETAIQAKKLKKMGQNRNEIIYPNFKSSVTLRAMKFHKKSMHIIIGWFDPELLADK